jgi:hypothetical protein
MIRPSAELQSKLVIPQAAKRQVRDKVPILMIEDIHNMLPGQESHIPWVGEGTDDG